MSNNEVVKTNLPTLKALNTDNKRAFKNDQLNYLLNQDPPKKFVKDFPSEMGIRGGGSYLPIDKVEFFLTRIFQQWKVEILDCGTAFQSCFVTVRLHYLSPATGEWSYHDGIGAAPVQTDAGKSAADLAAIKSRAVQIAFPIAKSLAIKDAADHLGRLFGRDINRKDPVAFTGAYFQPETITKEDIEELYEKVKDKLSPADRQNIERVILNSEEKSYKKAYETLKALK